MIFWQGLRNSSSTRLWTWLILFVRSFFAALHSTCLRHPSSLASCIPHASQNVALIYFTMPSRKENTASLPHDWDSASMDPLTPIGFAGNIVQFVDFGQQPFGITCHRWCCSWANHICGSKSCQRSQWLEQVPEAEFALAFGMMSTRTSSSCEASVQNALRLLLPWSIE